MTDSPDPIDKTALIMLIGLQRQILTDTLLTLANHHGGQAGSWLDKLETKALRHIKNTATDRIALEVEHAIVLQLIRVTEGTFTDVRRELKK